MIITQKNGQLVKLLFVTPSVTQIDTGSDISIENGVSKVRAWYILTLIDAFFEVVYLQSNSKSTHFDFVF